MMECSMLGPLQNVQSLSLRNWERVEELETLNALPNLEALGFWNVEMDPNGLRLLPNLKAMTIVSYSAGSVEFTRMPWLLWHLGSSLSHQPG